MMMSQAMGEAHPGNEICKPLIDRLGFSEGYELCLCVGLGYADEAPEITPRDMGKVKFVE